MPYQDELIFNDPDKVQSPDDVELPRFAHHLKIRAELTKLVELGLITNAEGDQLYDDWRSTR